jgi:hypothetical protein
MPRIKQGAQTTFGDILWDGIFNWKSSTDFIRLFAPFSNCYLEYSAVTGGGLGLAPNREGPSRSKFTWGQLTNGGDRNRFPPLDDKEPICVLSLDGICRPEPTN